jgi:hypothetical protein
MPVHVLVALLHTAVQGSCSLRGLRVHLNKGQPQQACVHSWCAVVNCRSLHCGMPGEVQACMPRMVELCLQPRFAGPAEGATEGLLSKTSVLDGQALPQAAAALAVASICMCIVWCLGCSERCQCCDAAMHSRRPLMCALVAPPVFVVRLACTCTCVELGATSLTWCMHVAFMSSFFYGACPCDVWLFSRLSAGPGHVLVGMCEQLCT